VLAVAGLALALLALACAASGPPAELADARAAYARAASGPAARLAPGLLRSAQEALARAEASGGAREEARERAYVALRRAETAEASALAMVAVERRDQVDREIAELERRRLEAPMLAAVTAAPERPGDTGERTVTVERVERPAPAPAPAAPPPAPPAAPASEAGPPAPPFSGPDALERLARQGQLRQGPRGVEVTMAGTALFAAGEARLLPQAMAALEDLAAAVNAAPGRDPVVLEVHTAGGRSREAELLLSQQRAELVRSFLVARGVEPDRVIARGVGTDRPRAAAPRTPGEARPAARPAAPPDPGQDRLEIILPPADSR
jgi:outer membrane protein OmpA-like peptidoglycan-associated protein